MKNNEALPPVENQEAIQETNSALAAQLAELKSEEHRLELEERKYNLILKKDQVAKMQQAHATRLSQLEAASMQIQAQLKANKALQEQCTHMKGGTVVQGDASVVMNGHGSDSADYCVIKHVLPSGRLMILCQRCLQEEYSRDPLTGEPETPGFAQFKRFPTRNGTSASSQFWGAQRYQPREVANA